MEISPLASAHASNLTVITKRNAQSPDPSVLDDTLASPALRQSLISVRERAERYIEEAASAASSGRRFLSIDQKGSFSDSESGFGSQAFGGRSRWRQLDGRHSSRPTSTYGPNVFRSQHSNSDIEDEYLRRLNAQYTHSLSMEQRRGVDDVGVKFGRPSTSLSDLPRATSGDVIRLGRTRSSANKPYRTLLERELAENQMDYDVTRRENADSQQGNGVVLGLKPAVPPVKKMIMRRQSSLLQLHNQQNQYRQRYQQPPTPSERSSSLAPSLSLLTLDEMASAAEFRRNAPPPVAPKSLTLTKSANAVIAEKAIPPQPNVPPPPIPKAISTHKRESENRSFVQAEKLEQSNESVVNVKAERRSPAARYFSSEYEQMRMAGYQEAPYSADDSLLLRPVRSITPRPSKIVSGPSSGFVSPRGPAGNEVIYDPKSDYVICTVDQLKQMCATDDGSFRSGSWSGPVHRPQPRYRPVVTPKPEVIRTYRGLVDSSSQTNLADMEWRNQQSQSTTVQTQYADQQSHAQAQRMQAEQRRLSDASQFVQQQQRMDEQRLRLVVDEELGGSERQHHSEYEFEVSQNRQLRSTSPTWRRLYYVSPPVDVIKNRITRSQEVLNEECSYNINLRELRNRFLERPEHYPPIQRVGRVWQPPPDRPYEFPRPRPPFKKFVEYIQDKEYSWIPVIYDSEFKFAPPPEEYAQNYNGYQQTLIPNQIRHQQQPITEISPGYSSVALSDHSAPQSASNIPRPIAQSANGHPRLENEPTPRHPSTITTLEKPRVNIRNKILSFENDGGGKEVIDPRSPRREFGVYHTRPIAVRSTSIDDDLMSSPQSSMDRRSVHFANATTGQAANVQRRIQPPPTLGKKELEDLAELAQRRERLLDRARHRSAVNVHELRKPEPEVPPIPTRDRYKEFIEETASSQTYASINGNSSTQQNQSSIYANGKLEPGELTRSQSLLASDWEYGQRQHKSQSYGNLASWQFSRAGFSPRSVISINGGQDLGDQLRIRTDLSPASLPTRQIVHKSNASVQTQVSDQPQMQQQQFWPAVLVPIGAAGTPSSTMTREFKEETKHSREVERYSSLNDLDESRGGTMIKIHDESSRRPKGIMKTHKDKQLVVKENWDTAQHVSNGGGEVVRQIAPKVTETVSTVEETKRTEEVERRVRESKDKKRSSKKHKSGGGSGHHRESRHQRSSSSSHAWGPRAGEPDYPPWTAPFGESPNAMWRQQHAITANGHSGSQRYGNSGQQVHESYHRQTTTKRVMDNNRNGTRRVESRSPSPVWWTSGGSSHQNGHHRSSNGHRSRPHKSQSSREIYHNELPEDYDVSRGGRGPIIEYPPTLPREHGGHPVRVARNGDGASDIVHKSRSYNDWDDRRGNKDNALTRKWEADMTGLERDFRDSLLMPMPGPGQHVDQREHREEQIPGGHETFSREVHANSGSRPGHGGANTRYSEAKQETSYRREQASDRRPY